MSGRQSGAVTRALELALGGLSLTAAAKVAGCHLRSVRRALRRFEASKGNP